MNNAPNIHAFFHPDLDGVTSFCILQWLLKRPIPYTIMMPSTVEDSLMRWKKINTVEDFDKIFILDLDAQLFEKEMDYPNVVIFDHHSSGEELKFKQAQVHVREYSSNALHMYDLLKGKMKITDKQKTLILLADDVDSHSKKTPISNDLNIVFHNTTKKVESFIENFHDGFSGFNKFQNNIIDYYNEAVEKSIANTTYYCGEANIQGKNRKIYAAFVDTHVSEISDYLIDNHGADMTALIIKKTSKVSFRRGNDAKDLDLNVLAKALCGKKSGGHVYAAGGVITETFLTFAKSLKEAKL